ncbi:MAG: 50S ribosomal protein L18 [Acidaminococcus sp.]|nr:50S ribosomal protein L18 [Acidaminococcus sp.]MDD7397823.1 50S ribosomal protein L18 [Bacillota bacterium]MDY4558950.1 50S ribosomal protein L18 [Eubacteriales bacterium]MDY5345499.1 50S ribosomal protein L18 [Eubacteriales bacterium]
MINKKDKNADRLIRHKRVRKSVNGTSERPRLSVYRSANHIYAQIIDDVQGVTLVSSSTLVKEIAAKADKVTKIEAAKLVGADVAKKAIAKGIDTIVFDRGGYIYTGRVEALADAAREAGLKF